MGLLDKFKSWRGGRSARKVKNKHDSATRGRRGAHIAEPVDHINDVMDEDLDSLRSRSMGTHLNSGLVRRGVNVWVSDEIGSKVSIVAVSSSEHVNSELNKLWKKHERFLDSNRHLNLLGILTQATRERKVNGEVFIRRIRRKPGLLPAPLQVQLVPGSSCPNITRTLANGNKIRQGIEFNRQGVRVAAWFYKDDKRNVHDLQRITMDNLIHSFVQEFCGQIRGRPASGTSILTEADLNRYTKNELQRKGTQSGIVGMITRGYDDEEDLSGSFGSEEAEEGEEDDNAQPETEERETLHIGGNEFLVGGENESMVMNTSPDVGQSFKDFVSETRREITMGLDVPYALITGDYSGVSDRTLRQINNMHRRNVGSERAQTTEFLIVATIWRWFVDAAVLAGLNIPDYWKNRDDYRQFRFTAEAHPFDHATQDIKAAKDSISLGSKSVQSFNEERGTDWKQNLKDKAEYMAEIKKLAAKYSIEPSEITG